MRPVTEAFLSTVSGPHRVATECRVFLPDGSSSVLDVVSGGVTLDSTAAFRGSCSLVTNGVDWVPTDVTDRLAPYGNEINVKRGVYLPDGSVELVSLGWFGIEDVDVDDEGLQVSVTCLDRANRISLAKFEDTFSFAPGTVISEGILLLAQEAWPDVPYDPELPSATALALTVDNPVVAAAGDDRWEFMQGLAKAIGMVLYFDGDGLLTLRPYANAGVVLELFEGDGGVLVQASRNWSRTDSFNRVVVTGENTASSEVFRAVATDDDSLSPTYYNGAFGRVPHFFDSPYVGSVEQAQDAANAILAQELGTASNVSFGMVPNPALEPDDTVLIRRVRAGIDENHIVDSLTIGLGADEAMTGSTRERLVS